MQVLFGSILICKQLTVYYVCKVENIIPLMNYVSQMFPRIRFINNEIDEKETKFLSWVIKCLTYFSVKFKY